MGHFGWTHTYPYYVPCGKISGLFFLPNQMPLIWEIWVMRRRCIHGDFIVFTANNLCCSAINNCHQWALHDFKTNLLLI